MKNQCICLLLLCLPCILLSQTTTCDYSLLLSKGKAFAKNRQYKKALYIFNSARSCDKSKGDEVNSAIEALLDSVEAEKKAADEGRIKALKEKERADMEKSNAEKAYAETAVALDALKKTNREMANLALERENALQEANEQKDKNIKIINSLYFYQDRFALAARIDTSQSGALKYGYINKNGDVMIDYQFDQAQTFEPPGYAQIKKGNKIYLLDTLSNTFQLSSNPFLLLSRSTPLATFNRRVIYKLIISNEPYYGEISAISLTNKNLRKLPREIFSYSQLTVFLLSGNQLSGLPKKMKKFKKLERLYLANNNFTLWPDEIQALERVNIIDLSFNQIGVIPESIQSLHNLKFLNLKGNPLPQEMITDLRSKMPWCKIEF